MEYALCKMYEKKSEMTSDKYKLRVSFGKAKDARSYSINNIAHYIGDAKEEQEPRRNLRN
ncbi:Protein of unknown function [Cotesia congregata]|uniref:Uncharacterized protein n=1 Tax=Cotesia congregata TaxID=51543 RepID=A0A8J2HAP9_COTCN|nr:Protein of unknown function [Cotesia congregata]